MNEKHFTEAELSARWILADSTLQNWRSLGIGPVFLKLPNHIVYRVADV